MNKHLTDEQIELVKKFSECRFNLFKLTKEVHRLESTTTWAVFEKSQLEGITGEIEDIAFDIACSLEKTVLGDDK